MKLSPVSVAAPTAAAWLFFSLAGACGAADYNITVSGSSIVITDAGNHGDTLSVTEPAPGKMRLAAAGRSFRINSGVELSGDSGDISLTAVGTVSINAQSGDDTIDIGAFPSGFPALTVSGGQGLDTVYFDGDLVINPGRFLQVETETVNVTAGHAVRTSSSSGSIVFNCGRSVSLEPGSSVETSGAGIDIQANQMWPYMSGNFTGVSLNNAVLRCNNGGMLFVAGRGGDDPAGTQDGVAVLGGSVISVTGFNGEVTLTGTGGDSPGPSNRGVWIAGSTLSGTNVPRVNLSGIGGAFSSAEGTGVLIEEGSSVDGVATSLYVNGAGAGRTAGGAHHGLHVRGSNSRIHATGELLNISGSAGPAGSSGLCLEQGGELAVESQTGRLDVFTDSLFFDNSATVSAKTVSLLSLPPALDIDLGGPDVPGVFGLAVAELNRITCTELIIGGSFTRDIVISSPVSRVAGGAKLTLTADRRNGGLLRPNASGADVTLGTDGALQLTSSTAVSFAVNGLTPDTQHTRLSVVGSVNLRPDPMLDGPVLSITGSFAGTPGNVFTIVRNDGTDPVTGTFYGLAEGAFFRWPLAPSLLARISYTGGSGNDISITLVAPEPSMSVVTSTADAGPGTLRNALAWAAARPGPDTVTFAPLLSGGMIVLGAEITIADTDGVTVDASLLPDGITIDGGPGSNRLFTVPAGSTVSLTKLSLTGGGSAGGLIPTSGEDPLTFNRGGAIYNSGRLTLNRCALFYNGLGTGSAPRAGGAIANYGGTVNLTDCTLYRNSASLPNPGNSSGGAIFGTGAGFCHLTRCTLTKNSAREGGAVFGESGTFSFTHCTVSLNIANTSIAARSTSSFFVTDSILAGATSLLGGEDACDFDNGGSLVRAGTNIIRNFFNDSGAFAVGPLAKTVDPLLCPLQDFGGPTRTMALLPGSEARDAAVTSTATVDQRGLPIVGIPDIGAYEAGNYQNFNAWIWEMLPSTAPDDIRVPSTDFDADGLTNFEEWQALSDPVIPAGSLDRITFTRGRSNFTLGFPTVNGRNYTLWRSDSLSGPWMNAGLMPVVGTGVVTYLTLPDATQGVPRRFYRVQAAP